MYVNRMMRQFRAIFGLFMVFFYLGTAIFLLFYADRWFALDKAMIVIISIAFIIFGTYRAYLSYKEIKRLFFTKGVDDDDTY